MPALIATTPRVANANLLVLGHALRHECIFLPLACQSRRHPYGSRGIGDVDGLIAMEDRVYLHGRVRLRGRRPPDQKGNVEALTLHFRGHVNHFIEGRRDQTRQADQIGVLIARSVENALRGHHDAKVYDLEVVALQYDPDNVLANVVNVALYSRKDYASFA